MINQINMISSRKYILGTVFLFRQWKCWLNMDPSARGNSQMGEEARNHVPFLLKPFSFMMSALLPGSKLWSLAYSIQFIIGQSIPTCDSIIIILLSEMLIAVLTCINPRCPHDLCPALKHYNSRLKSKTGHKDTCPSPGATL